MELYQIIKRALMTEKSTLGREAANQYNFEVDPKANKIEIKQAIEKIFKVRVLTVRVLGVHGKVKRVGKAVGKRKDWKKAIVTLAAGDRIETIQ
jgi:large subunit ribosomal protein L23